MASSIELGGGGREQPVWSRCSAIRHGRSVDQVRQGQALSSWWSWTTGAGPARLAATRKGQDDNRVGRSRLSSGQPLLACPPGHILEEAFLPSTAVSDRAYHHSILFLRRRWISQRPVPWARPSKDSPFVARCVRGTGPDGEAMNLGI